MEKAIKNIIYRTVKFLANVSLFFFYRRIEKSGQENIPKKGPFIYAVNHQNAFLDAVIVGAFSPVPTYFMTRSDVFKPPFDWILDALKMMPIYRIRDGYNKLSKNDAVFETCSKILLGKEALLIFPEGNHGLDYYLRPLTKGLARIALQSQEKLDEELKIIPVGLNYFDHFNSGHKLLVKYGKPIEVSEFMPAYKEHHQKGYRAFTEAVTAGMQETLVIPNNSETYDQEKLIFQRTNESLDFKALTAKLKEADSFKEEKQYKLLGIIGELFSFFNLPPIVLTKFILKTKVSQKIFSASIKIAFLMLIFPLWFFFIFGIVWLTVSLKWALIVLAIQLGTLIIRRELVRYSH